MREFDYTEQWKNEFGMEENERVYGALALGYSAAEGNSHVERR
jgi:hypothetical protein